jgi:hypothetical protein
MGKIDIVIYKYVNDLCFRWELYVILFYFIVEGPVRDRVVDIILYISIRRS